MLRADRVDFPPWPNAPSPSIDILTSIDGVDFPPAFDARLEIDLDGVRVPVISRSHLIQNKLASGRTRDLADLEALGEA